MTGKFTVKVEQFCESVDASRPFWNRDWLGDVKNRDIHLRDIPEELVSIVIAIDCRGNLGLDCLIILRECALDYLK